MPITEYIHRRGRPALEYRRAKQWPARFPLTRLPVELQYIVWEAALPRRLIGDGFVSPVGSGLPIILQVSRQTRKIGMKWYQLVAGEPDAETGREYKLYVNYQVDTFYVANFDQPFWLPDFSQVRHMAYAAVIYRELIDTYDSDIVGMGTTIPYFVHILRRLKTIVIMHSKVADKLAAKPLLGAQQRGVQGGNRVPRNIVWEQLEEQEPALMSKAKYLYGYGVVGQMSEFVKWPEHVALEHVDVHKHGEGWKMIPWRKAWKLVFRAAPTYEARILMELPLDMHYQGEGEVEQGGASTSV
ncbi:hypothetical protein B0H63DRAFT_507975 [Podospora didyma]|uniref:2EXR domain-containing protein n=1 Tax=Podospora didyma TaxID=330526 RepID=A0AAE0NZI0_9PEZI|nr:hypothetical protein B0H63DRAFT_507975 [Podospora didyma]